MKLDPHRGGLWLAVLLGLTPLMEGVGCEPRPNRSMRLFGNGVGDIDRVKIRIDDPATSAPGPPADIGAADFTLEFWMRATAAENRASAGCGNSNSWISGNIVVDRDRFGQPRNYGISLGDGIVHFGVMGESGDAYTLCGLSDVRDDVWHHVAVQRRRLDGWMWLYVDGILESEVDGPDGDVSYPDDGVPGNFCGGPCDFSDPFIVVGAEKHDADPVAFPSYSGWFDELRISTVLRYSGPQFPTPTAPFVRDGDTAALYHFNEPDGNDAANDSSLAPGGPSHGFLSVGGTPAGPLRSSDHPFAPRAGVLELAAGTYDVDETAGTVTLAVRRIGGSDGAVTVDFETLDGTATAPDDYQASTGTVSFADGESADRTFDVPIVDDALVEGSESFAVRLLAPGGGATLGTLIDAGVRIFDDESPAPVTVVATVMTNDADADYHPPEGEALANVFDAFGVCAGRDGSGEFQAGFRFVLDVPQGAQIENAILTVTATGDQSGAPTAELRAYDVGSAAPFTASHSHALTAHHGVGAAIDWIFPAFVPAQRYDSPDLGALVQAVVDRGDWVPSNALGLVVDGSASASGSWRCMRNQSSGDPAELSVTYLP